MTGERARAVRRTCEAAMTRDVVTVDDELPIEDAIRIMKEKNVSLLPVLNSFGGVQGTIAENELAGAPRGVLVRDVMTRDVLTCWVDDDVELAADRMAAQHATRILCLDQARRLVGVISLADIARAATASARS